MNTFNKEVGDIVCPLEAMTKFIGFEFLSNTELENVKKELKEEGFTWIVAQSDKYDRKEDEETEYRIFLGDKLTVEESKEFIQPYFKEGALDNNKLEGYELKGNEYIFHIRSKDKVTSKEAVEITSLLSKVVKFGNQQPPI